MHKSSSPNGLYIRTFMSQLDSFIVQGSSQNWTHVVFQCDSLLWREVLSQEHPQYWAIFDMVIHIRRCLVNFCEWKIAWVPRRCTNMAHNLAKQVARFGRQALFFLLLFPSISGLAICFGLSSCFFCFNEMRNYLAKKKKKDSFMVVLPLTF